MKDQYVVVKLITGEQIIATLHYRGKSSITVKDAMLMKHIPMLNKNGDMTERVMTSKFCYYADDEMFDFDNSQILFVKPLKQSLVSHYLELIDDFAEDDKFKHDSEVENLEEEKQGLQEIELKTILH